MDTQDVKPQYAHLTREQKNSWEYKQMTSQKYEEGKAYKEVGIYPFRFGRVIHRYKEDIALFAEMGLKVYRLSIKWAHLIQTVMMQNQIRKEFNIIKMYLLNVKRTILKFL